MVLIAATGHGVWRSDRAGRDLAGHVVVDLTAGGTFALVVGDRQGVWADHGDGWAVVAVVPGPVATCLSPSPGSLLVGTREAHLLRVSADTAERVASFDQAPGRDAWYTPWGAPADTRTISAAPSGAVYVNVHVGGILRSEDGGDTWEPTIDVDADVHQVLAHGDEVLAATAYGCARSADGGRTWSFLTDGLHGSYSRAVAVAGDWLLLSASTGPGSTQGAVYRRPLAAADSVPFERCTDLFPGNIDTGSLVADGETAALASGDGTVYLSDDAGATWHEVATGLGRVNRLAFAR